MPTTPTAATAAEAALRRRVGQSFRITYPLVVASLSTLLLVVVDTALLGQYSTAALVTMAAAAPVFVFASAVISPLGTAAQIVVAQWLGAEQHRRIARLFDVGALVAAVTGLAFFLGVAAAAEPLLTLFAPDAVSSEAALVLQILSVGLVFTAITAHYRGALGGLGLTGITMRVTLVVNLANLVFDVVLVFGLDLGAVGSAVGTAVSTALGAALVLTYAARRARPRFGAFRRENLATPREVLGPLWRVAWPDVCFGAAAYGADLAIVVVVSQLGGLPLAGYRLFATTVLVLFVIAFSCSNGISILAGQRLGAGDPAGARAFAASGGVLMAVGTLAVAAPVLAAPQLFYRVFSSDPGVVGEVAGVAGLFWVIAPAMVLALTLAGLVRGSGDTKSMMYVGIVSQALCALPLAWALGVWAGWGLLGVTLGLTAGWLVRCLLTWLRARTLPR